jgi:predicted molibdopterin-dependent oxidoreductase YjgC
VAVPSPSPRPLPASSLRLAVADKLYDGATLTQRSPSLAHLAPAPRARLHPEDFLALRVAAGAPVTISSSAGQLTVPAVADRHVGRGTVVLVANLPGAEVNRLLVAGSPITDVRIEPAAPARPGGPSLPPAPGGPGASGERG